MKIQVKKKLPTALVPTRATEHSTGLDLYAAETVTVRMTMTAVVDTGIQFDLMSTPPGMDVQVRPRSGLAARHGLTVLNSPGTIDRDYTGTIKVILVNHGEHDYTIQTGERIAQVVFAHHFMSAKMEEVEDMDVSTPRAEGGLGSTGK